MTQGIDRGVCADYGTKSMSSVMSRWLWILLAVFISTGVYFTIRYGLRPKPIPVLDPTDFTELRQIGVVIYKRLHQNVRAERLVVLGSSDEVKNYEQVWTGLIESAIADKEKLVFFLEEGLKPLANPENAEVVNFNEAQVASGSLYEEVARRLQRKQLVIVHARTVRSSHLVKDSLSLKLDPVVKHPVLAISETKLAVAESDVNNLYPQCVLVPSDPGDPADLTRLKCAAYKVARKFLKKRLAPDRIWAVVERHGLKEYLVFIHQP